MPANDRRPTSANLSEILEGLLEAGVDFILVGGLAAVIQGAPVTTMDVDIVHNKSPEKNLGGQFFQIDKLSFMTELRVETN
jgi:hypothetical protein